MDMTSALLITHFQFREADHFLMALNNFTPPEAAPGRLSVKYKD